MEDERATEPTNDYVHTFGCGCKTTAWRIIRCPLHEAAQELLAACEFLVAHHERVCDATCNLMGVDQMRDAIRKARGGAA